MTQTRRRTRPALRSAAGLLALLPALALLALVPGCSPETLAAMNAEAEARGTAGPPSNRGGSDSQA
ncbi:hypothetical protein [Craurococcus roseus]|uniref:hypothetical protein n=1 Tax=Craurococcus roseus TaxID=77585 RepID=UPI0031D9674C